MTRPPPPISTWCCKRVHPEDLALAQRVIEEAAEHREPISILSIAC